MIIAPSILSVQEEEYKKVFERLNELDVSLLHLDIMDGKFVSNTTYGAKEVEKIKKQSNLILDTHLMITHPETEVLSYALAGSAFITFHYEATNQPMKLIETIKQTKASCGISIKPFMPVQVLEPYLPYLDLVLIMSVEPGKGGQPFLPSALDKIQYLKEQREKNNYTYLIEVDGGINLKTAKLVKDKGADIVVVGTYLMNSKDIEQTYKELRCV